MRANSTIRPCEFCGTEFRARASRIKAGYGRFCSRHCGNVGRRIDPVVRFWSYVNKTETCWVWTGTVDPDGYGFLALPGSTYARAHRFSWELHNGPIPDGLWVLHHCDNPPCVRPDHLFLGTTTDNMRDAKRKGRLATGDRSGSRLHPESRARGDRHWARRTPEHLKRGDQNPSAKLTEDDVLAIRASSETQTVLARRYGVSQPVISAVVLRKTWRHV